MKTGLEFRPIPFFVVAACHLLLLLLAIGCFSASLADLSLECEWLTEFGEPGQDEGGEAVAQRPDGGFVAAGHLRQPDTEAFDFYIVKATPDGVDDGTNYYGINDMPLNEAAMAVLPTAEGYVTAGWRESVVGGDNDIVLVTWGADLGSPVGYGWGDGEHNEAYGIVERAGTGYALTGRWKIDGVNEGDLFLMLLDEDFNEEITCLFGGDLYDRGADIIRTADGRYAMAGGYRLGYLRDATQEMFLVVSDENCDAVQTHYTWDTFAGIFALAVKQTSDGGYILAGKGETPEPPGDWNAVLVKMDADLQVEGHSVLGGDGADNWYGVAQTPDGGYIVAGNKTTASGDSDVWIAKFDSNLTMEADTLFGGPGNDAVMDLEATGDGTYIVTGYVTTEEGDRDLLLTKWSLRQCAVSETEPGGLVARLWPSRPNPLIGRTMLSYSLFTQERVLLTIHDLQGQTVASLVDERQAPGRYAATWNGRDQSGNIVGSGVYWARLRVGWGNENQRLVLVR